MLEKNKRRVLKKLIHAQGLDIPGQSFPEQMTAFYEGRIAAALAKPKSVEKYLALQNIQDAMQDYINENNRVLKKRAEIASRDDRAAAPIGVFTLAATAVTSIALFIGMGGMPSLLLTPLLKSFAFSIFTAGNLMTFAGVTALATNSTTSKEFEKLAASENTALTGLSKKVQQEMALVAKQTPAQAFLQSVKASSLHQIDVLRERLHKVFKGASGKKNGSSGKGPDIVPPSVTP